ncbi:MULTISPECIES: hypothetical protein [Streptomyces]|uniref:hypothetical protein n=1 Tax=Streptomyces TaxID=1883 RepID=UPI0013C43CE2|nr:MULTISPECIES: hypothetical protein [Streptomyces]MDX3068309.1 hypothetical protein [Streptomyces sp. ND04-05B]MDX3519435.1 hypothetical protein [Streptomyces scabiei]
MRHSTPDATPVDELTSCQVYGHLYEPCVGHGCTDDDCRVRTCADCGDEYEDC